MLSAMETSEQPGMCGATAWHDAQACRRPKGAGGAGGQCVRAAFGCGSACGRRMLVRVQCQACRASCACCAAHAARRGAVRVARASVRTRRTRTTCVSVLVRTWHARAGGRVRAHARADTHAGEGAVAHTHTNLSIRHGHEYVGMGSKHTRREMPSRRCPTPARQMPASTAGPAQARLAVNTRLHLVCGLRAQGQPQRCSYARRPARAELVELLSAGHAS